MRRKTNKRIKNRINKYTAFVPKTMKATKSVGTAVIKKLNYFLSTAVNTVKNKSKLIDKKTAKSIRSFTKRRIRK
jgi:hypothetical protein